MKSTIEDWVQKKNQYLTAETLETIENEWRDQGLEAEILAVLYDLWLTVQKNKHEWDQILVQKSVNFATNSAWGKSTKNPQLFNINLHKMAKTAKTYYLYWYRRYHPTKELVLVHT